MSHSVPLAVVGCGSISDSYYFPALATLPAVQPTTWLVEPDRERGRKAAAQFGFQPTQVVAAIDELPPSIKAAINATPSHLHAPTTRALIARGINVLLEKPLAEHAAEAQALVDEAQGHVLLTVNQFRRLWPSYILVAEKIRAGAIGTVKRVTWFEGRKFEWPVRTGFMFRRPWSERPRGALLDMGVHMLDTLCWWLNEVPTVKQSRMDGLGGPEAFVAATLQTSQATIELKLSFLAKLANEYLIEGTTGAIRGATSDYSRIELRSNAGGWRTVSANDPADRVVIARRLITNFLDATEGKAALLIDAASAVRPLIVIDALYRQATDIVPDCYREWADQRQPTERQASEVPA
jgi:predicted dehydrogenase